MYSKNNETLIEGSELKKLLDDHANGNINTAATAVLPNYKSRNLVKLVAHLLISQ